MSSLKQAEAALRSGDWAGAIVHFRTALAERPGQAAVRAGLALALVRAGQQEDGARELQAAVKACESDPAAIPEVAACALNLGAADLAFSMLKHLPEQGLVWQVLALKGDAARNAGDLGAAEQAYSLALERGGPEHLLNSLGLARMAASKIAEARQAFTDLIAAKPDWPAGPVGLAMTYQFEGKLEEAEKQFRKAMALAPNAPEPKLGLASVLRSQDKGEEAQALLEPLAAQADAPGRVLGLLAAIMKEQGKTSRALELYHRAREAAPGDPGIAASHASALYDCGEVKAAVETYRQLLARRALPPELEGSYLLALHYLDDITPDEIAQDHFAWGEAIEKRVEAFQAHDNDKNPQRRLRIAYLSPDFANHSVARFALPVITAHNRDQVEVFCYAQVARPDDTTAKFKAVADHWRDARAMNDQALAAAIRADKIDILVDLAGHTRGNRLGVMAAKPAPVSMTWLGYPDTTGLTRIDYRLTDAIADPPGVTEKWHSEKPLRLDTGFLCFAGDARAPQVQQRPDGPIIFGSFNTMAKLSPKTVTLWAKILQGVPDSKLMLKAKVLGDEIVAGRIAARFAGEGISSERLILKSTEPSYVDHLALYNQMDVALDSFPYNGTTTNCEALWMGTPIITWPGAHHVSRVTASILTRIGHSEWITETEEGFVACAIALASDRAALTKIHLGLRAQMKASPLCDAPAFVTNLESVYREVFANWCET